MTSEKGTFVDGGQLLEPPPPYAPPFASDVRSRADSHPNPNETFDSIEEHAAAAKHSYEYWHSDNGFLIMKFRCDRVQRFVGRLETADALHLILYNEDTQSGHPVVEAKCDRHDGAFHIRTGDRHSTAETDWLAVRCVNQGLLKSKSYHFEAMGQKFALKHTHDSAVGSSKLADHDFKLVDMSEMGKLAPSHSRASAASQAFLGNRIVVGGDVVATFLGKRSSSAAGVEQMKGCFYWRTDAGNVVELTAIGVLVMIFERMQRHK